MRDRTGEETCFEIKRSTTFEKLISKYAQHKGVTVASLRFLIDGVWANPSQTCACFDMKDGDQIDVMMGVSGGFRADSNTEKQRAYRRIARSAVASVERGGSSIFMAVRCPPGFGLHQRNKCLYRTRQPTRTPSRSPPSPSLWTLHNTLHSSRAQKLGCSRTAPGRCPARSE